MQPQFEHIDTGSGRSTVAYHYADVVFEAPWHFHPQLELTLINSSSGTRFVGDHVSLYQPGELVLIGSNLPHCWKNQVTSNSLARSTVVQWDRSAIPKAPELAKIFELLSVAERGLLFDIETSRDLHHMVWRMPDLSGHQLFLQLLHLLVELTTRRYDVLSEASFKANVRQLAHDRIGTVQEFVQSNYSRKIYLEEVAVLTGLSRQAFSRFFSETMGRPFFQFLNEFRINVACRLLLDTDLSVSEISYRAGFESRPFFFRQFRRFVGQTPRGYRKQLAATN